MPDEFKATDQLKDYYRNWIAVYKEGAIRDVTLSKYKMSLTWIEKLAPDLKLCDVTRTVYQQIINEYAKEHERQTTMDFHHQLKGAILDAVDEGLIQRDPTRKVIIKGCTPADKKKKYLNQFELHTLLKSLTLGSEVNWDWFILLVAKTGMRFSEALAITPADFDFARLGITKMAEALHRRKTVHLSARSRLTGRWSCSLHHLSKICHRTNRYLQRTRRYTIPR